MHLDYHLVLDLLYLVKVGQSNQGSLELHLCLEIFGLDHVDFGQRHTALNCLVGPCAFLLSYLDRLEQPVLELFGEILGRVGLLVECKQGIVLLLQHVQLHH